MTDLGAVLTAAGIPHRLDLTPPRPGAFTPAGVMIHHTAGIRDRHVVRNGRTGLPGPLGNFWIGQDASVWLITNGRANDSGTGVKAVLDRVRADEPPVGDVRARGATSGNPWFYDIEMEGGRHRRDFTQPQLEVARRVAWALCAHFGWSRNRIIGHREWTARKIDPSVDDFGGMDWFRQEDTMPNRLTPETVRWALTQLGENPDEQMLPSGDTKLEYWLSQNRTREGDDPAHLFNAVARHARTVEPCPPETVAAARLAMDSAALLKRFSEL